MQSKTWTPISISRSGIRAVADTDSDNSGQDDVVDVNECVMIDYLPINGRPGFEIETRTDSFWSPIAHRTRSSVERVETHSNNT